MTVEFRAEAGELAVPAVAGLLEAGARRYFTVITHQTALSALRSGLNICWLAEP